MSVYVKHCAKLKRVLLRITSAMCVDGSIFMSNIPSESSSVALAVPSSF